MFQPGDKVKILPPFADGGLEHTVAVVQFVAADGSVSEAPTDIAQYILDGPVEGSAYAEKFLEAA